VTFYIGLLRAVNLGGSTQLSMGALRDLMIRKGYKEVRTLLQSGNVIFQSEVTDARRLERSLERALDKGLGHRTDFFLRSATEWRKILERNPFPREANADPAHLVLTVLKDAPSPAGWAALGTAIRGRERLRAAGREAYIVYPDGIGTSKLTAAVIEKALGTRGTSRNWNTVQKLGQLAPA
jgi:uncharacterized protein (DUF1697 family)